MKVSRISCVFIIANKSSVIRCKKNRKTRRNKRERGKKETKIAVNENKVLRFIHSDSDDDLNAKRLYPNCVCRCYN